jgi:hypothetical protein
MTVDMLWWHFSIAQCLGEFVERFIGAPGAIFAVCLWCFRAIWRLGK